MPSSRRPLVVAALAATISGVLGVGLYHQRFPTAFDRRITSILNSYQVSAAVNWLELEKLWAKPSMRWTAEIGGRATLAVFLAAIVALAWRRRDLGLAVIGVGAPVLAGAITEFIGKPLVDRRIDGIHATFPSGHVTSATAIATVCWVAAHRRTNRLSPTNTRTYRIGAVLSWMVWLIPIGVGVAVVRLRWHVGTDVLGGFGVGVGVVFGTVAAVNTITARRMSC